MSTPENPPIRHEPSAEQTQTATNTENRRDQGAPPKPIRHEVRDWLMFAVTLILVIATIFYVHYAKSQRDAMLGQTSAMIAQREVMDRQLDKMQQQVDEMRTQSGTFDKTLHETRRGADAAILSANAGQVSANAAQETVGITQQSFRLLERPSLGIDSVTAPTLDLGKESTVGITVRNFGHIPARDATVNTVFAAMPVTDIAAPCPEITGRTTRFAPGLASKTVIAVNSTRLALARSITNATAEDINRITEKRTWWIYVYLVARYGEHGRYILEYYARHNVLTHSWEECGTHNRAN